MLAKKPEQLSAAQPPMSHEAIEHAMRQLDSFIDVGEADLNRIYQLAREFDKSRKS